MATLDEETRVKEHLTDVQKYREATKRVLAQFDEKELKKAQFNLFSNELLKHIRDLAWQWDLANLKFRDRAEYDVSGPIVTIPEWGRDGEPLVKESLLEAIRELRIPKEEPTLNGPVEHLWGLELEKLAYQYDLWEMQKALERENTDWATVGVVALRMNYRLNEKQADQPTWVREHQDRDWQLARFEPHTGLRWHQDKKDDFRNMHFVLRAVPERIPHAEASPQEYSVDHPPAQNIVRMKGKITRTFPAGFDYVDEHGAQRTFNINDAKAELRKKGLRIVPQGVEIVLRPY